MFVRGLTQPRRSFTETLHLSRVKPSVPQLYWEDFTKGRVFEHGPRRVPRDEMIGFAAEFDPQPMHLDEAAARDTMLGGLAASGWYACCIMMRMCVDAFVGRSSSMGAPGVDEVKWLLPIRPDDELHLRATVAEARASKSRPDMGIVRFDFEVFNGSRARVMTLTTSLMLGRRNAGAPP
jgi:acyl dehydratase